jgi:hypothetical protein
MRQVPMSHNTDTTPYPIDHQEYLTAIGYTQALRQFSSNVAALDNYRQHRYNIGTYGYNLAYGRMRYWRNKLDTIIRTHSCHVCNRWTGTHYLHADNYWLAQQSQPEFICDHCLQA